MLVESRVLRSDHHNLADVVPLSTPYALFIDVCSACNFHCTYCPTGDLELLKSVGRKAKLMSEEMFRDLVDDLKEFPQKVKRINLYKDGEPTLHPKFCELARYLKDAGVVESIWVKTNGSTLKPAFNEQLVHCGLDMIGISVQGSTARAFLDIAGVKMDYEQYRANILDLFHRSRGKVQVSIKVADYGQGEQEKQKFVDDFQDRCDFISIEGLHGWGASDRRDWRLGTDRDFDGTPRKAKIACPFVVYMLAVNSNGKVSICNDDWMQAHQIGDVSTETLKQIWEGEMLRQFRLMHLEGRRSENPSCATCDYINVLPDNIDEDLDVIKERLLNG